MTDTHARSSAGEQQPLLGSPGGRHNSNAGWRGVLLNKEYTPGMDSPRRLVRWPAYGFNVVKATLLYNWINLMLVFVPVGIVAGEREWSAVAVFTINFIAIIPLASVLSFATEQLSERVGDALGGLVNATFGNAVELIVSIVALRANQIEIVQSSMIGSILSNMLLVLGMCFFFGGLVHMRDRQTGEGIQQDFAEGTAQTTCSVMALSSAALVIPAALYAVLNHKNEGVEEDSILLLSRGTSIIMLMLYIMYLYFQLRTHKNLFKPGVSTPNAPNGAASDVEANDEVDKMEEDTLILDPISAFVVLFLTTVVISYCADYMVESIDTVVATGKVSKNFIGLILIPIVGNAAEHVTAVVGAVKNKMDMAMGVAIGSSIQIALGVTPFLVIMGWIMDKGMSLRFETFETIAFAFSVVVVTSTVQDGKSNYLEGAMLMGLYIIIAVAFWATPSSAFDKVF